MFSMWLMREKKAEAFLQFQASYKLYLPMGHIKSTMKNDEEFIKYFKISEKWLHMHHTRKMKVLWLRVEMVYIVLRRRRGIVTWIWKSRDDLDGHVPQQWLFWLSISNWTPAAYDACIFYIRETGVLRMKRKYLTFLLPMEQLNRQSRSNPNWIIETRAPPRHTCTFPTLFAALTPAFNNKRGTNTTTNCCNLGWLLHLLSRHSVVGWLLNLTRVVGRVLSFTTPP